jgi:hypothetical protein
MAVILFNPPAGKLEQERYYQRVQEAGASESDIKKGKVDTSTFGYFLRSKAKVDLRDAAAKTGDPGTFDPADVAYMPSVYEAIDDSLTIGNIAQLEHYTGVLRQPSLSRDAFRTAVSVLAGTLRYMDHRDYQGNFLAGSSRPVFDRYKAAINQLPAVLEQLPGELTGDQDAIGELSTIITEVNDQAEAPFRLSVNAKTTCAHWYHCTTQYSLSTEPR